jgi:hypothetical protein
VIDWTYIAREMIPVAVCLVIFGMPALCLWIVRETRFRTRQLELTHDKRISDLQRERDVLEARLHLLEPELEFLRQVVRSPPQAAQAVRARVATLPHLPTAQATPEPTEAEEVESEPVDPLHARAQTR